jgi:MerR family transcriptional regulator, light-induced transcriptional regulator
MHFRFTWNKKPYFFLQSASNQLHLGHPLTKNTASPSRPPKQQRTHDTHAHRSGAVARMLGMPVATLRVWERRYALTQPELSPGGQRLYSAHDVRRLALLKQLTDQGHAIGSLAPLDMRQLQRVASTHASTQAATHQGERAYTVHPLPLRIWRVAVIGTALGARLQRPALLRQLAMAVVVLGPFENAAQAGAALTQAEVDAVLHQEAQLHADWLAAIDTAAPTLAAVPKVVLYGFAADPVCEALATSGTTLLREPQPDVVVAQWLRSLSAAAAAPHRTASTPPAPATAPRRWNNAALAEFIAQSSTVACECPRHVAELLVQLSHFEDYSAECAHRSPADAQLHAFLHQLASASRARFEAALEHVARHEGLRIW